MLKPRVIAGVGALILGLALLAALLSTPHAAAAAVLGALAATAVGGGLALLVDPFRGLDQDLHEQNYLVHHTVEVDRSVG